MLHDTDELYPLLQFSKGLQSLKIQKKDNNFLNI